MRSGLRLAALTLLAIGVAASARATEYDWSYKDPSGNSGSGTLTLSPGSSPYTLAAITGTFDGIPVASVAPPGTCCSSPANDNLVYIPSPYLDLAGIGFYVDGGTAVNLYFIGSGYAELNSGQLPTGGNGYFTLSAVVPEPAALGVFGLGLAALATVRRRRA
ncbi:MAG TPA: PEP-CTERM sorting domain-containing protein [Acetobacteraceae bacterium]|nr:PEP-CTERM sorting domain-containing protein [Acetobacteraceae bacterium]